MDNSIEIEPIQNSVDVFLVKVESITGFVSPVQSVVERKELE